MKKLSFLISLLFMLSLLGCQAENQIPPIPDVTSAAKESPPEETATPTDPTDTPSERVAIGPALAEGPDGSLVLILTDFFSLTLPHEWANTCVYTVTDLDQGAYCTNLYESESYWEFGGGNLCSLMLMPAEEDYTFFPSYQFLGFLDTPDGTFNLVVLFPTDVQFTEDTMDVYNQMASQLPDVLCTLNPVKGVELALP